MYKILFDRDAFKQFPILFIFMWIVFLFAVWVICKFSLDII